MWINVAMKVLAGALAGGVVGYLAGYARSCSTQGCDVRPGLAVRLFYIFGAAVFGAGIAWYFIHR